MSNAQQPHYTIFQPTICNIQDLFGMLYYKTVFFAPNDFTSNLFRVLVSYTKYMPKSFIPSTSELFITFYSTSRNIWANSMSIAGPKSNITITDEGTIAIDVVGMATLQSPDEFIEIPLPKSCTKMVHWGKNKAHQVHLEFSFECGSGCVLGSRLESVTIAGKPFQAHQRKTRRRITQPLELDANLVHIIN